MKGVVESPGCYVDVQITDEDSVGAKRRDCYDDPVARACRHALGDRFLAVAVDGRIIVRGDDRCPADCACDEQDELARRIRIWDDGGEFEPFAFTLACPFRYQGVR